ncbi:hypothetical protein ABEW05_010396 [Botrytis cinerea]
MLINKASIKNKIIETFLKNILKRITYKCIAGFKIDLKKSDIIK